jgi:hypothetical protein
MSSANPKARGRAWQSHALRIGLLLVLCAASLQVVFALRIG